MRGAAWCSAAVGHVYTARCPALCCAVFAQGSPTCFTVAEIELTMSGAAKSLVPFLTKCLKTSVEHGGLDCAFQGVKVVSAVPGHCTFSMVVEEGHANM